jgi:hypothetical protein
VRELRKLVVFIGGEVKRLEEVQDNAIYRLADKGRANAGDECDEMEYLWNIELRMNGLLGVVTSDEG